MKIKRFFRFSIVISVLFLPFIVFGSSLSVDVNTEVPGSGVYVAEVYIDTNDRDINAIDGEVSFDSKKIKVEKIYYGKSIVQGWVLPPFTDKDRVKFSGIIPNGFIGDRGHIFTMILSSSFEGEINLRASNEIFLNDGKGTSLGNSTSSDKFLAVAMRDRANLDRLAIDDKPPKILQSVISENEAMFEGKPFIVVTAKDDESGVSKYEIAYSDERIPESILAVSDSLAWQQIESPAVLDEMFRSKYVYARAIDTEGNLVAQLVSSPLELSPESLFNRLKDSYGLGILVVLIFGIIFSVRRFLRRHASAIEK